LKVSDRMERRSARFYDAMRSRKARDAKPTAPGFDHLEGHKYALLVTYKRSGEGVPTPVWFGIDEQKRFYCRTGVQAAKTKRIHNNPRVRVAPCTVRGTPKGPYADGTARICERAEHEHAEQTIQANYSLFRRFYERSAAAFDAHYIEVTPAQ
jgi:PPOX class probable F420-dependent enzyme